MYDTVIGNRPNEQGLIDVHNPAVYNIPNDLIDSTIFVVVDEDDEEDEEFITAFASDAPILWAEYIVSSNIVPSPIILISSSEEEIIGDGE